MRWPHVLAAAPLCLSVDVARGQITRTNYRDFLPPRPPAVAETRATVALGLFGRVEAPGYADADGDGVDDARAAHLRRVGEHFSPLLRRNNFSVPRDPWAVLARAPVLIVDRWAGGRLARSDSIPLAGGVAQQATPSDGRTAADGGSAAASVALRSLVTRFGPRSARPNFVTAERDTETILFVDLPGHDPRSWRVLYERVDPPRAPRAVLHPFVLEHEGGSGPARFQLVLQYWFFYPFNDALNTHEGDWEHVNVRVTTRAAASTSPAAGETALLDSAALARVLAPSFPVEDSLTIAAVDYYFHESVVSLDYLAILSGAPARSAEPGRRRRVWEDVRFVSAVMRRRASIAGGKLASHPVVHVGGNNKGPDELLAVVPRFHGSYKRDSHGSYPFSGTWETIGPLGATEKLYGDVVPRLHADTTLPWHALLDDPYFVHFRAADLLLVPDWERLEGLVATHDDAARRWTPFLLPVYWGFPASESLGSGRLRHFDVGNVALLSPPFHSTWNRVGASARHHPYEVRVLRTPVSPTSPWSGLQSGWGVLNVPLAAWGLMPGYNVALMQLMPWLGGAMNVLHAPPARTYTSGRLPRRFTTAGPGVFLDLGGRDFANALPRRGVAPALDGGAEVRRRRRAHGGPAATFDLFFTDHLALENGFAVGWSDLAYDVRSPDGVRTVEGELVTRQLTGGLRLTVASTRDDVVQLYSRAGYGWLSYRVDELRADGARLTGDPVRGGYLPPVLPARRWWPNGWYVGGGVEAFTPERFWLLGLLGCGARVEFTEHFDALHFSEESGRGKAVARRGVLAASLVFGW